MEAYKLATPHLVVFTPQSPTINVMMDMRYMWSARVQGAGCRVQGLGPATGPRPAMPKLCASTQTAPVYSMLLQRRGGA